MSKTLPTFRLALVAAAAALVQAPAAHAQTLPPDDADAAARLEASPRHGEWVRYDAGDGDMVEAWVTYPERSDAAPVVVVIHDIAGMSDWVRAVGDQLAADGFIAVVPDLLSGKGPGGGATASLGQGVGEAIRDLDRAEINRRLRAAGRYGLSLPAAGETVGVVGYCWGGSSSWLIATDWPQLDAAVIYYGGSPDAGYENIQAPVLGLYGGVDHRVNATIPPAEEAMSARGKTFEPHVFDGAGHGFLRRQRGQDGANLEAARAAWPRTIEWFRRHLGR